MIKDLKTEKHKMNNELKSWYSMGRYFIVENNKSFYIDEGKGYPLLVFHGYPYNGYDFKYLLPELSKRFRVIIPDMLGMGFSDKPSSYPYSIQNHLKQYCLLLQHLNINEINILSHDLGNSVVQELLANVEDGTLNLKIRSIAFLNGGLFSDVYRPRFIQVLLSKSHPFIGKIISQLISKRSIEKATCSVFGANTQPSKKLLQDYWEILNYNKGKLIAWKIGRLVFEKDIHQKRWITAMQKTKIPMCLINGPFDPNSGLHMAKRYLELIPNADIRFLSKNIGHWPQIEAPDETLMNYFLFLKSIEVPND